MKKIRIFLSLILVCILFYCVYNIYSIKKNYTVAENEYDNLLESFVKDDVQNSEIKETENITNINDKKETIESTTNTQQNTSQIPSKEQETIINQDTDKLSQENNLSDFKNIDFNSLLSLNNDTIGWIIIPGTKINYPILHSKDNDEYLHLTFLKEENSSGSIFMDKNNESNFSDYNTIIYGHNMRNGSMFSLLKSYKDETFYKQNKYVQIYTPTESNNYQIIACYETYNTSNSYKIDFSSLEDYKKWLEEISLKSLYKTSDYDFNKNTITLSTCIGASGQKYRWVIHLQKIN